jgi:hypothetical protein
MSAWGNTDNHNQKPKSPAEREVRENVQLYVLTGNTAGNNVIQVSYADGGANNVANIGVTAGQYVYFWTNGFGINGGQAGNGIPGMFQSNTTVSSTSGNTITLSTNLFNTVSAGFGVEFDKAIAYNTNKGSEKTYNQDTVLVTPTRLANAVFASNTNYTTANLAASGAAAAHAGWVKVTTGTGGRAGRVQTEVLVALANPVASNTSSGQTSNTGTYFTGV